MVDWNKFKGSAKNITGKAIDKANEVNERRSKSSQETKIKLVNKKFGQVRSEVIRKDINGYYYVSSFYSDTDMRYTFENLEFEGTTIVEKTTGNIKKQSKKGQAILGGALFGAAGAVVSASGKRKDKVDTKTVQEEKAGKGSIYLRSVEDNDIKKINFTATESEFQNIVRFFNH